MAVVGVLAVKSLRPSEFPVQESFIINTFFGAFFFSLLSTNMPKRVILEAYLRTMKATSEEQMDRIFCLALFLQACYIVSKELGS